MAVSSVHNKAIEERIAQHTSLVELFHLLDRAIDGIDGVESEEGVVYWFSVKRNMSWLRLAVVWDARAASVALWGPPRLRASP